VQSIISLPCGFHSKLNLVGPVLLDEYVEWQKAKNDGGLN